MPCPLLIQLPNDMSALQAIDDLKWDHDHFNSVNNCRESDLCNWNIDLFAGDKHIIVIVLTRQYIFMYGLTC